MADAATDHEARRIAALALSRIEQHEKHCEERARKAEIFEGEMRSGLRDIAANIKDGTGRIHGRLDNLIRGALVGAIGLVISLVAYIYVSGLG